MQYMPIGRRQKRQGAQPGVYAELDDLMRLRYKSSGFSFLPRQPIHSVLSGRHASRLRGRGLNFEELRSYLPGDDTRNIDWRVTARTGEPHVRVHTEEKDRSVWLLVDQRIGMFFGSRRRMKSVVAAEAAAIAAWRVLAQGDRVGAVVFNDQEFRVIPPHRSAERVTHILKTIVGMNHALNASTHTAPEPGMLNRAMRRAAEAVRHDCLVCLITDGSGADVVTRRLLTRMTWHNDVLAAIVYDPLERTMPQAGRLLFSDGLRQVEFDTGARALRDAYQDYFEQRMAGVVATTRRHSIPLLALNTVAPVLDQVREYLGESMR